jgi:hypothetical protein
MVDGTDYDGVMGRAACLSCSLLTDVQKSMDRVINTSTDRGHLSPHMPRNIVKHDGNVTH